MESSTQTLDLDATLGASKTGIILDRFTHASFGMTNIGVPWTTGGGASVVIQFQASVNETDWIDIGTPLQPGASPVTQVVGQSVAAYSRGRFIVSGTEANVRVRLSLYLYDAGSSA